MTGRSSWPICSSSSRTFEPESQTRAVSGRSASDRASWKGARSLLIVPVWSPRRSRIRWSSAHRWQGRVLSCQVVSQVGQRPQKFGSGLVHLAHKGASQVPLRTCATVSQPLQVAQRCWQRSHQGWPVAREISHSAVRRQIAHSVVVRGRQLLQRGPSGRRTATALRCPQLVHFSRLAGSRTRQLGHSGPPSASRAAGSRTAPHRVQGTAAWRAKQARQIRLPSSSFDSAFTPWQRGQAGLTATWAPASESSSMNRSNAGAGASQPAPVRRSGRASTAQARRRCPARRTAARPSAARTASALMAGSRPVTSSVSSFSGSPAVSGQSAQRALPWRSRLTTRRSSPQPAQISWLSKQDEQPHRPSRRLPT